MPANSHLDTFKSKFLYGVLQSPSRYEVDLILPETLIGINDFAKNSTITIYPTFITLPNRGFVTQKEFLHGIEREIPVGRYYEHSIIMNLYETEGNLERETFEMWMDEIIKNDPWRTWDYRGNYEKFAHETGMIIKPLTKTNEEGSRFHIEEIYPSEILPIEYSSSKTGVISEISIKFNYVSYFMRRA